jgi:hypothetical protein
VAAEPDSDEVPTVTAAGEDDDLSTNRWDHVARRTSGVMRAVVQPSVPPPLPPGPLDDSVFGPLPAPPADSAAPLDEPFGPAFARGSGAHLSIGALGSAPAPAPPEPARGITIVVQLTPTTLCAVGLAWTLVTGIAAWAGAKLALGDRAPAPAPAEAAAAAPAPAPAPAPPAAAAPAAAPAPAPAPPSAPTPAPPSAPAPAPAASSATCPTGMVPTGAACIDRFEAPGEGRAPTTGVTRAQAASACAAAGKRLCTGAEWERACRGARGASYPWGASFAPGRCNVRTGAAPGPTGALATCRSASGAFDMSGNVAEWVADGAPRGGSSRDKHDGRCSRPRRGAGATAAASDVGFRCCADPR